MGTYVLDIYRSRGKSVENILRRICLFELKSDGLSEYLFSSYEYNNDSNTELVRWGKSQQNNTIGWTRGWGKTRLIWKITLIKYRLVCKLLEFEYQSRHSTYSWWFNLVCWCNNNIISDILQSENDLLGSIDLFTIYRNIALFFNRAY